MADRFGAKKGSLSDPAIGAAVVTPDNDTDLPTHARGICFAAVGALSVVMDDGVTVTFPDGSLAAGVIHPLRVQRVRATGTTATGIVAVY